MYPPNSDRRQTVLSLLVLFDNLIVHNSHPNEYRIPDLEHDGILQVVNVPEPITKPAPLKSKWLPSRFDPRPRAPTRVLRTLAQMQSYRPLIVDRLVTYRPRKGEMFEFESFMAKTLRISRRRYFSEFLDLAINYVLGNKEAIAENVIERALPKRLLNPIKRELFDFSRRGKLFGPTNATLIAAIIFAQELGAIQELSSKHGVGVATHYYRRARRDPSRGMEPFGNEPSQVPRSFRLIRSILHEEGHFFPRIESISHALKLRVPKSTHSLIVANRSRRSPV